MEVAVKWKYVAASCKLEIARKTYEFFAVIVYERRVGRM